MDYKQAMEIIERDGLQWLIDDIESFENDQFEHATTDENSIIADFVQSFGYGEGWEDVIDAVKRGLFCSAYDDVHEYLISLMKVDRDEFKRVVEQCARLEPCDIYVCDYEIFSAHVGEMQEQLPDDIISALDGLTDEQRKAVERAASIAGEYTYINADYNRWVMVLDPEMVRDEMKVRPTFAPVEKMRLVK